MAELPATVVSHEAMAIFRTNKITIALNTFITLSFLGSTLDQVKKLVMANTDISVILT